MVYDRYAPVHIIETDTSSRLDRVKVVYFPPNLTIVLHPLDGGIIRSFKARARKYSVMKLLNVMDGGSELYANDLAKKFTILDAMKFITQSWAEVKKTTIMACFKNAGFCFEPNNVSEVLDDGADDDLAEILQSIFLEEEPYFEQDLECYEQFTQDIVNYVF